ncbi:MAG: hypothetical protein J1F64_02055 [Oscillospiraceae bacterium]|nr:hypothetical protein [Oscillospiraceae bacterium]
MEKKKLIINCAKCDAREIKEEAYVQYERIVINTELLLVNDISRIILSRLNAKINAAKIFSTLDDVSVIQINNSHKITAGALPEEGVVLMVNGDTEIEKGANEAVRRYSYITVNGNLECPESAVSALSNIDVNGSVITYPDDYTKLRSNFVIDKYFPMRAEQNGKYYVGSTVKLLDKSVDTAKLIEKNVKFKTGRFVVPEEKLEECISMFDENTEFMVAPAGCAVVDGSAKLNTDLINEYGTKLFIYGNLDARGDISDSVSKLERLAVTGKITATRKNADAIRAIAENKKLEIVKDVVFANTGEILVTTELLHSSEEGITVQNSNTVTIEEGVSTEDIEKLLEVKNAGSVVCSESQTASVRKVCKNVGSIMLPEKFAERKKRKNPMQDDNTVYIDTEEYVM